MKKFKKIITAFLAVALMASLFDGNVFAAKETYTYTISFHAGAQGTFTGTEGLTVDGDKAEVVQTADKIVVSGLEAGDVVSFNAQSAVAMNADSKHYVQGVRLSGRDNDTVAVFFLCLWEMASGKKTNDRRNAHVSIGCPHNSQNDFQKIVKDHIRHIKFPPLLRGYYSKEGRKKQEKKV